LAFFLVPFGGLLLGRLVTGNYTGRYTLSFIVGTAILLGYALWQLDAQRTHFAVVLGVVALGFGMKTGIVDLLRHAPPASKVFDSYDHPALREYADLPVAVGSAEALYGSELYGNPTWKHRVTGVVDSVTDNETAGLAAFLRYRRLGWTVLPMQDAEEFIVAHRRFLMWGEKNISPTLRSKNARIEWEGTMGPASLYLVTLP
jgi:hypothetical protein